MKTHPENARIARNGINRSARNPENARPPYKRGAFRDGIGQAGRKASNSNETQSYLAPERGYLKAERFFSMTTASRCSRILREVVTTVPCARVVKQVTRSVTALAINPASPTPSLPHLGLDRRRRA